MSSPSRKKWPGQVSNTCFSLTLCSVQLNCLILFHVYCFVRQSSSKIFLPVAFKAAAHALMLAEGPHPSIFVALNPSSAVACASCVTCPQSATSGPHCAQ